MPLFTRPRGSVRSLLMALLAALSLSSVIRAEEAAKDYLSPIISRPQFAGVLDGLDLNRDATMLAELLYADYADAFTRLCRETDAAADRAGRDRVNRALAGRLIIPPDELRQLRAAVIEVYRDACVKNDALIAELFDSLEFLLMEETDSAAIQQRLQRLRRQIVLHPRQEEAEYPEYAGDGVDVLLLLDEALADDGEFAAIDPGVFAEARRVYARSIDALLKGNARATRDGAFNLRIARLMRDREAILAQQEAAVQRWQQLYELNRSTVDHIGALAEHALGTGAKQAWKDRFAAASFTWLFSRRTPDKQYEWIMQQNLPEEVTRQATAIHQEYQTRRRALAGKAIQIMLRGRLEFRAILNSMTDPSLLSDRVPRELYEQMLRNSGELSGLESDTADAFNALLDAQQREKMQRAIRRR
jgi:hypothetical protein